MLLPYNNLISLINSSLLLNDLRPSLHSYAFLLGDSPPRARTNQGKYGGERSDVADAETRVRGSGWVGELWHHSLRVADSKSLTPTQATITHFPYHISLLLYSHSFWWDTRRFWFPPRPFCTLLILTHHGPTSTGGSNIVNNGPVPFECLKKPGQWTITKLGRGNWHV